jgi:hypothetical protein
MVKTAATSPPAAAVGVAADPSGGGWTVTPTGTVSPFGGAPYYGSIGGFHLNRPIVGMAATPDGKGYWLVASDGGVFTFGDAVYYGSTGGLRLNKPVVGMAATPDGKGYWLVASDGGVFTLGDAAFYGSTGGLRLNEPIVGMAATPDGKGYWLVASDGGIFTLGNARYYGSTGAQVLTGPVVGMSTDPATGGYWLVTANGLVYPFNAPNFGTAVGQPVVGMVPVNGGAGYEELSPNGVVLPFGGAPGAQPTLAVSNIGRQNIFGDDVATMPVSPYSGEYVSNLVKQYQQAYGSIGVNQMPLFTVPASQPLVTVTVKPGCNDFLASTGAHIPIPVGAYTTDPNYLHDSDIVISQPSTNSVWELWEAANNGNGTWSACWGGKLDTATTTGVFPYPLGLSATGISYYSTMITEADIESGSINHAIAMQEFACNQSTYPADRGDCGVDPGEPPEGTWFRMPAGLPMPAGLTPFGQMVFRALQRYGMVVTDRAGAVMVQAESSDDWTYTGHAGADPLKSSWQGAEYSALRNMPWQDLQVITPPHS